MSLSLHEEKKLISDCYSGTRGAWERFVDQYSRLIYYSIQRTCFLKSFRLSGTELEDLFNDVFVSLIKDDCKKLRQYRGDHGCSVASWIRTITASQVLDYIRKAGKSISYVDIETEEVEYELVCESSDPAAALEERERQETVSQAMAQLSENDKFFIELYYRKELPPEEVAEVLGLSVNTVYSRISRIKSRLQEIIDQNARKPVK